MTDYSTQYSETSFWEKVKKYAVKAGCPVIRHALVLYYCLRDEDTPAWARTVIIGVLGYFVTPIDAIPDLTPVVGYTDDLGALVAALAIVEAYIKPAHRDQADKMLKRWFAKGCDDTKTLANQG